MRPEEICGLLAEHDRLAVFAAVVLGSASPAAVAARTGLSARDTERALRRLTQGGLVRTLDGWLVAHEAGFKEAVREYAAKAPRAPDDLDPDRSRAAVLRAFVRDGRLERIPAARGKRRIVLDHIAACFEPGVRYPEREVDAVLRAWHPDHASLRRYLVDEGLMTREQGIYWRSGGPVEV
ncbi:MAG: DUF2087 domain-containing protein [Micromonosporaceae bacterium]|nr:DUF2087 domain-containing protein [Micromonosporaceae bacterium]